MNYLSLQVTRLDVSEGLDDLLIKHAEFVVHQVYSYEDAGEDGEQHRLVHTEAMKQLIRIAGIRIKGMQKKMLLGKDQQAKKVMIMMIHNDDDGNNIDNEGDARSHRCHCDAQRPDDLRICVCRSDEERG